MRLFCIVFTLVLITSELSFGQTEALTNVRFQLDSTGRILILYDLKQLNVNDSIYVEAYARQSGPLKIRTIEGDIGKGISVGFNKTIYWFIIKDGYLIDEEVQIKILIKHRREVPPSPPKTTIGGGPANALVSVILPGVGNIFVQPKNKKHRIGFRPLLPIISYGLAGFSVYRWIQSKDQYKIYGQQTREEVAQPIYDDANNKRHQAILTAAAAASIWSIDVVCTFVKGVKNNKKRRAGIQSISIGTLSGIPTVGLKMDL